MAKQHFADPTEVAEIAKEFTEAQLECRTMGHTWRPETAEWVAAERAYDVTRRCPRCKVRRYMTLDSRGHIVTSSYDYSEAGTYQLKGVGRIVGEGNDALRLESVTRLIPKSGRRLKSVNRSA